MVRSSMEDWASWLQVEQVDVEDFNDLAPFQRFSLLHNKLLILMFMKQCQFDRSCAGCSQDIMYVEILGEALVVLCLCCVLNGFT